MRMRKIFRSALAMSMAVFVSAVPMGVYAGEADETELMEDLEEAWEESLEEISADPYEADLTFEFGDGLYDLVAQSGQDASWLKSLDGSVKIVQGDEIVNSMASFYMNDARLCNVLVSVDTITGMIYVSIPDYIDQTAAISPEQLMDSVMDGSAFTGSGDSSSMQGQIIKMLLEMGMNVAEQFAEFFRSVPAETWQEELMNYLIPVMSSIQQDSTQEVLTAGDLSADVQTETFMIPSEQMGEVVKSILDTLSQDELVESFLQSDAISDLTSFISLVSGGSVSVSGQSILNQFHSVLESVAAADLSGIPGIFVSISQSEDGQARGAEVGLESGGMNFELLTCKEVFDGAEHAYEVTPGMMLLSMSGQSDISELSLQGQGSTAGGMLNEEMDLMVNGESAAKLTVTDLDLASFGAGRVNGTIHLEAAGITADVIYGTDDNGSQTIEYLVNDKVFYSAVLYQGAAEDDAIDEIDLANLAPINSIQDLQAWIETFDIQAAQDALSEAGIPLAEEDTAA